MRPQYHFTPSKGWINDPNGTVYADGKYHLFFQHYPYDNVWGPMHWGHAISEDMLHWEEKEIAIAPDELGYIFSGSCVIDTDNISGFGDEKPAMIAMYTSHKPDTAEEQQCIAYSTDYIHFTKFAGNPVIKNTKESEGFMKDFRDPKMFHDEINGGYTAVLSGGDRIVFYNTKDFINWEKKGEFIPQNNIFNGVFECPDLVCFATEDGNKYVLTMSITASDNSENPYYTPQGHVMPYFIGEWNGRTFIQTEYPEDPLLLDFGYDNYAMVSFGNISQKIYIGWAENWQYVSEIPCKDYRGMMTLPREANLEKTDNGYIMTFKPAPDYPYNFIDIVPGDKKTISLGEQSGITISCTENEICITRRDSLLSKNCYKVNCKKFSTMIAKRHNDGVCHIEIFQDYGIIEIFADNGMTVFTISTDIFR